MVTIFSDIGNSIDDIAAMLVKDVQSGYISDLLLVAKAGLVLYIIIYGYAILAGKKQALLADLLWDLSKFAIILAFMQNAGGLLTVTNSAVDGIKEFFSNGVSPYSMLDKKVNMLGFYISTIWDMANGIEASILAILRIVALFPLVLGFTACGALIIFTEIIEKILLATAPIFIFCLMWGFLKNSFEQWLEAILGNALILLMVNVILEFSYKMIDLTIKDKMYGSSIFEPLILSIIAGLLSLSAIKWGREIAINLARVSVDKAFGAGQSGHPLTNVGIKGTKKGFNYIKSKFSKN